MLEKTERNTRNNTNSQGVEDQVLLGSVKEGVRSTNHPELPRLETHRESVKGIYNVDTLFMEILTIHADVEGVCMRKFIVNLRWSPHWKRTKVSNQLVSLFSSVNVEVSHQLVSLFSSVNVIYI